MRPLAESARQFDEGIESLGARLRFATYGEPAFDALLDLTQTWDPTPCVRRISVTPTGLHNEYVGYVAAAKDANGGGLKLVTGLDDLAEIELDAGREVTEADADAFVAQLRAMAAQELKLSAHVAGIESDNQLSGREQAALALGTAFGLISGRQNVGNADENFWKELDGLVLSDLLVADGKPRTLGLRDRLGTNRAIAARFRVDHADGLIAHSAAQHRQPPGGQDRLVDVDADFSRD